MTSEEGRRRARLAFAVLVASAYAVVLSLSTLGDGRLAARLAPVLLYAGLTVMVAAILFGASLARASMIGTPFWQRHGQDQPRPSEERLRRLVERAQSVTSLAFLVGLALVGLAFLLWQLPG